jgi:hypothetical protein
MPHNGFFFVILFQQVMCPWDLGRALWCCRGILCNNMTTRCGHEIESENLLDSVTASFQLSISTTLKYLNILAIISTVIAPGALVAICITVIYT